MLAILWDSIDCLLWQGHSCSGCAEKAGVPPEQEMDRKLSAQGPLSVDEEMLDEQYESNYGTSPALVISKGRSMRPGSALSGAGLFPDEGPRGTGIR